MAPFEKAFDSAVALSGSDRKKALQVGMLTLPSLSSLLNLNILMFHTVPEC